MYLLNYFYLSKLWPKHITHTVPVSISVEKRKWQKEDIKRARAQRDGNAYDLANNTIKLTIPKEIIGIKNTDTNSVYIGSMMPPLPFFDQSRIATLSHALYRPPEGDAIREAVRNFHIEPHVVERKGNHPLQRPRENDIQKKNITSPDKLEYVLQTRDITSRISIDTKMNHSVVPTLKKGQYTAFTPSSLLSFSSEQIDSTENINSHQKKRSPCTLSNSNAALNKTSIFNALPGISDKTDKRLWISTVLVHPKKTQRGIRRKGLGEIFNCCAAISPQNICRKQAKGYCLLVPLYGQDTHGTNNALEIME